ncbi:hypothetical protein NEFER03_0252 [Nematocida sp. LUAm3]|nr:hypothetical protein NEFER03_0252 [Nematocida sp. LUAm3]KAI5173705.1 hypothetical protein NEFER02_0221 [Nematocida sp. LUAm2]KAI5176927.1 hypothetical protein NEFER01_0252 [Nematocida sp. LUAm1]
MAKLQEKNLPHIGIFGVGVGYAALIALQKNLDIKGKSKGVDLLLDPRNYALVMLVLLFFLFKTKKDKLLLYHKVQGTVLVSALIYMILSCIGANDLLKRSGKLAQHYSLLYFTVGLLLSLRFLPGIGRIANEIGPNSYCDFKAGYLALNIAIYSTHTFSSYFFNRELSLPICNYGYIGISSVFYIVNTLITPIADRYGATKKMAILFSFLSTAVYSTFFILKIFSTFNIWITWSVFSIYITLLSPVFPLFDVLIMGEIERKHSNLSYPEMKQIFSRVRMWASIGHAIAGMSITYIYKVLDVSTGKDVENSSMQFSILIGLLIVTTSIFMGITYLFVGEKTINSGEKETEGKVTEKSNVRELLYNVDFLFLLFVVTIVGVTRGISSYYLVTYMSIYFGLKLSNISYIMCIRTISEMLIFYYSKYLLKVFGYNWLLYFALVAATFREFNYANMPNNSYTLVLATLNEMLKGISASCLVFSAVNIADKLSGKKNKALAQACYSACYNGISIMVSSLMGMAAIYQFADFRSLFFTSSMIGFTCSIVVIIKYQVVDPYKKRKAAPVDPMVMQK